MSLQSRAGAASLLKWSSGMDFSRMDSGTAGARPMLLSIP
jgi:hypothetical protein